MAHIWVNPYVPINGAQWLYFLCGAWNAKKYICSLELKNEILSCGQCFKLRKVPKTKTNWNVDLTKDKIFDLFWCWYKVLLLWGPEITYSFFFSLFPKWFRLPNEVLKKEKDCPTINRYLNECITVVLWWMHG